MADTKQWIHKQGSSFKTMSIAFVSQISHITVRFLIICLQDLTVSGDSDCDNDCNKHASYVNEIVVGDKDDVDERPMKRSLSVETKRVRHFFNSLHLRFIFNVVDFGTLIFIFSFQYY